MADLDYSKLAKLQGKASEQPAGSREQIETVGQAAQEFADQQDRARKTVPAAKENQRIIDNRIAAIEQRIQDLQNEIAALSEMREEAIQEAIEATQMMRMAEDQVTGAAESAGPEAVVTPASAEMYADEKIAQRACTPQEPQVEYYPMPEMKPGEKYITPDMAKKMSVEEMMSFWSK